VSVRLTDLAGLHPLWSPASPGESEKNRGIEREVEQCNDPFLQGEADREGQ